MRVSESQAEPVAVYELVGARGVRSRLRIEGAVDTVVPARRGVFLLIRPGQPGHMHAGVVSK